MYTHTYIHIQCLLLRTAMGPAKEKFFGPRPALLSEEELLLASKRAQPSAAASMLY